MRPMTPEQYVLDCVSGCGAVIVDGSETFDHCVDRGWIDVYECENGYRDIKLTAAGRKRLREIERGSADADA